MKKGTIPEKSKRFSIFNKDWECTNSIVGEPSIPVPFKGPSSRTKNQIDNEKD